MWRRRKSAFAAMTRPALRERPESTWLASVSTLSSVLPSEASWTLASIELRSAEPRSPISRKESTKKRSPASVGSRPALVCGA